MVCEEMARHLSSVSLVHARRNLRFDVRISPMSILRFRKRLRERRGGGEVLDGPPFTIQTPRYLERESRRNYKPFTGDFPSTLEYGKSKDVKGSPFINLYYNTRNRLLVS
jgi:hypothetical protein